MATRSRKLRKIWRILEKENSFAGTVQTLLHGTVAQVGRRRYCLEVKEQRHRKETVPWGQMLDLGGTQFNCWFNEAIQKPWSFLSDAPEPSA